MKHYIILIIACCLIHNLKGQNNSADLLSMKIQEMVQHFPKSKVVLKTDKDIYAPGDSILFKASVFNCLTQQASADDKLIVMLKAESGEIILDQSFGIQWGYVSNSISLPAWTPEGNYYLIGYTPSAINVNEATLAAIQPITVNLFQSNDYILNTELSPKIFKPGEEIALTFLMNTLLTVDKKERICITLFDDQKELLSDRINLHSNIRQEHKFKVPAKIEKGIYAEIQSSAHNKLLQRIHIPTTDDRINVEFYPEGGHLITNNIQRIVYRATDPFGKPAEVSGKIIDHLGNQAGVGKILKPGLGLISLMPMPGQTYTFVIDTKYGQGQKFEMPQAIINGCSFSLIKTEEDKIRTSIFCGGSLIGQNLSIAAIANGELVFSTTIESHQKNNLQFDCDKLPTGIIQFVVMDDHGKVLSERLLFNNPKQDINVSIETQLNKLETMQDAEISIDVSDFTNHFGPCRMDVKIVDAEFLYKNSMESGYTFLKYPLLTANPKTVLDIYLTNIELIANTFRYYSISEILLGKNYLDEEKIVTKLSGVVIDKKGKAVANAKVMAIHSNQPTIEATISDKDGNFVFNHLLKTKDLVIKAISESGRKKYEVDLDHSFDDTLEELLLLESFKFKPIYDLVETSKYLSDNTNIFKQSQNQLKIRKQNALSVTERMLQSGNSVIDVIRMIKPFNVVNNQIVFYGSTNSVMNQQGALIVVDGQKMGTSIDALNSLNPFDVVSVNISTDPLEIHRYTALNTVGIVEIRTRGSAASDDNSENNKTKNTDVTDANKHYNPTLLWKPNTTLGTDGKAKYKINLSQVKTRYKVQVDLISKTGVTHHETTEFSTY